MSESFGAAELGRFERDGYIIVPRLTAAGTCVQMVALAEKYLQAEDPPLEYEADVKYPGAPPSRDAPGGRTVRRLLRAYSRDPIYREWATSTAIAGRLRQLLRAPVALSQAHHNCIMTKHPSFGSETHWHQDIRYWSFQRPELISVWLALGQEAQDNGGLWLLPGTHTMNFEPEQFDGALFLRGDAQRNRALIATQVPALMQRGDVLFFHCRLMHAAGRNASASPKYSLVFTYRGSDNAPVPGTRSAALPEIPL